MKSRTYPKDVRAMPLLAELQAAGVPVLAVRPPTAPGEPTTIDLDVAPDDTSQDAATDAVVAAHDVAALDAHAAQLQTAYDDAVALLKQFRKLTPGTATNVQRDRAIGALIDVSKKLNADLREAGEATAP
jgi:hypothetical protein